MNRLISIIMLLLERKTISAADLARTFEVSKRTIYRDIETINEAGIPIITYPGSKGGIGIMEKFKVDKRLFSESDLTTLLIGLSGMHSALDNSETKQVISKLKAIIPKEKENDIDEITRRITIDLSPWKKDIIREGYLQTINSAIVERKILSFDYSNSKGDVSFRQVEPYRLLHKSSSWYLQGFCLLRQEMRTFRFSRIRKLIASERAFMPRDIDFSTLSKEINYDMPKVMVKIRFDDTLKGQLMSYLSDIEIVHENGKNIATIPILDGDIGIRFLLSLGESCECLEPQNVREKLIQKVEAVLGVYKKNLES
ncbi:YafY family protein [Clostridium sartagoforme]|jgi:predicted DNA-binding transcriptional regulator YafY|uniref:helix-turn-helix transcriptional regulator n=1 Tax=Clostridium sartagoforme TaxID=84031 RepID=UPI0031DEC74E